MTSKEKVKKIYPRANEQKARTTAGETYYLICSEYYGSNKRRLSDGKTKGEAWRKAAKRLPRNQK